MLAVLFGAVTVANAQISISENETHSLDNQVIIDLRKNDGGINITDLRKNDDGASSLGLYQDVVEQMPAFPGGDSALMKYIATHLRYPALAQEYGVMGVVVLKVAIMNDGRVGDVNILKSMRKDKAPLTMTEYMESNPNATEQLYTTYLDNFEKKRAAEEACDNEAIRLVTSLPNFIPGRQQGKPVNLWCTIPVRFQLQ